MSYLIWNFSSSPQPPLQTVWRSHRFHRRKMNWSVLSFSLLHHFTICFAASDSSPLRVVQKQSERDNDKVNWVAWVYGNNLVCNILCEVETELLSFLCCIFVLCSGIPLIFCPFNKEFFTTPFPDKNSVHSDSDLFFNRVCLFLVLEIEFTTWSLPGKCLPLS